MTVVASGAKQRLDHAVVDRGLADTRSRAKALILAGNILVNGAPRHHAGTTVSPSDELALRHKPRFVSRGGEKLEFAIEAFGIDASGAVCADIGASTGGFSDCLLQRGAERVYAIDVGYGQLDASLRDDPRVVVMERTNARYLESLPEPIAIVVIDASFISLGLILPIAARLLREGGICVPLIKPQFEAGRQDVGKGGVVRDAAVHRRVLAETLDHARRNGLVARALVRSPLIGPAGNVEFLAHLERSEFGDTALEGPAALIDRAMQPTTVSQ